MKRCAAARTQTSIHPCESLALRGHVFCSRHARMKSPVIWSSTPRSRTAPLIRAQALIRGWLIRTRIALAGPGAMKRTNLANDEDLMTCTEASRVSPLDYVSFEENGKIWWFEFGSLWSWSIRSTEPENPYTKVPLSSDTRRRLREIWASKRRRGEPVPDESMDPQTRLLHRWNVMCQLFADNGFININPAMRLRFTSAEYGTLISLFAQDVEVVLPSWHPFRSRILALCARRFPFESSIVALQVVATLLHILMLVRDPYPIVFCVVSSLFRC